MTQYHALLTPDERSGVCGVVVKGMIIRKAKKWVSVFMFRLRLDRGGGWRVSIPWVYCYRWSEKVLWAMARLLRSDVNKNIAQMPWNRLSLLSALVHRSSNCGLKPGPKNHLKWINRWHLFAFEGSRRKTKVHTWRSKICDVLGIVCTNIVYIVLYCILRQFFPMGTSGHFPRGSLRSRIALISYPRRWFSTYFCQNSVFTLTWVL